jgi:hypothetical protein
MPHRSPAAAPSPAPTRGRPRSTGRGPGRPRRRAPASTGRPRRGRPRPARAALAGWRSGRRRSGGAPAGASAPRHPRHPRRPRPRARGRPSPGRRPLRPGRAREPRPPEAVPTPSRGVTAPGAFLIISQAVEKSASRRSYTWQIGLVALRPRGHGGLMEAGERRARFPGRASAPAAAGVEWPGHGRRPHPRRRSRRLRFCPAAVRRASVLTLGRRRRRKRRRPCQSLASPKSGSTHTLRFRRAFREAGVSW